MKLGRKTRTTVLVIAFCCAGFHAVAGSSPLIDLLAHLPREVGDTGTGWATVRFVDYAALFESEGLSLLREVGSIGLLTDSIPLGPILSRIAAGPDALSYIFVSAGQMRDIVGFEWLLDVDQSLEFGDPPDLGLLLRGTFDAGAIGEALSARGFDLADVGGVPVWHRLDDQSISLALREIADPFGGHLGAAARVALLPDTVANARTWALIDSILSSTNRDRPSLADDLAHQALAKAISDLDGLLLQALFFPGSAFQFGAGRAETPPESQDDPEALPPFSLAVLADLQDEDDQVHLIGLVYDDEATARTAAQTLARRVEAFSPIDPLQEPLVVQHNATVQVCDVAPSANGIAISLVEARSPLPKDRIDPETGLYSLRGQVFSAWVQAILRRQFTPLE